MTKLGLVLSGGGAKGAYEIGVCRALKSLGKKPDIVTGTSIGAINGVFVVQKNLNAAIRVWKNINFSTIYNEDSFEACSDDSIIDIYKEYAKTFINEGGMDVSKLEKIVDKYFKAYKFYNSPIDYGIVTYNLSRHRPEMLIKKDLSKEKVKDYVIASASCYPAFKPKKIDNDLYIDGGYYDNFPINLAIQMGAEEIIGVDLRAVGFKRKIENKGIPITVISPKNKIVSFLVFDKNQSREAIKFGYNDTLKKFGKLDGDYFTFKKGNLVKNYKRYNEKMTNNIKEVFNDVDNLLINKLLETPIIKNLMHNKLSYKSFNKIIEDAGKTFNLKESKIYNINFYNYTLLNLVRKTSPFTINDIRDNIKSKSILNIIDRRRVVRLFLDSIIKEEIDSVFKFIPLFLSEFFIAVYIFTLKSNKMFRQR